MHWDKNTLIMNDSCQHYTKSVKISTKREKKKHKHRLRSKQYYASDCLPNHRLTHTHTRFSSGISLRHTHTLSLAVTLSKWQMAELSTPPGLLAQFPVRGGAFTVKNKPPKLQLTKRGGALEPCRLSPLTVIN